MTTEELHNYLQNPRFFKENTCEPHSDHSFFLSKEEADSQIMTLKQDLCGTWKFKYSKNLWERPEDFYKEDFDFSDFKNIKVPGHIELQGYGKPQYTNVAYPWDAHEALFPPEISKDDAPVGSYIKEFELEDALKEKDVFISFQGVESAIRVFVNGQYIGYSEDSFTPSEFEITNALKSGKNRLCVEVYKRTSASWLEDQDMWRFFGIFREVFLYAVPKLHTVDIFAKALLDENYEKGKLSVDITIKGEAKKAEAELLDLTGQKVASFNLSIAGNKAFGKAEGLVINPWSAESPDLYELRVYLYDSTDAVNEVASTRVGFRTFEKKNNIMLINGKRIVFKGVDRHEFSAVNGRAATKEEMLWDIKTFKKNNINAVRTSHYPNNTYWYKLCDEYGIYMIDETNLETHGTWVTREYIDGKLFVPGSNPDWTGAVVERAKNMMMRDKNHPAVLMWSLGNESFGGSNFREMSDFLHENDDTRLVHYEGIVHNREFDDITDMESNMYTKPQHVRYYLENNPKKPFILCEYMHAMGNSLGGMKLYTDLADDYEMYQGGFIWDYLDQALWQEHKGEKRLAYGGDFGDRSCDYCFCTDGIVFADRTESPKMPEVKNLYSNVKISVSKDGFTVLNNNLFNNLSRYYFVFTVSKNGKVIYTKQFTETSVAPGEEKTFCSDFESTVKEGILEDSDYVFFVKMCEKNVTKWAEAGYMVSFAESTVFAKENPALQGAEDKSRKVIKAAEGLSGQGISIGDVAAIFGRGDGGPTSLTKEGRELITRAPKPVYFRAYTDNDKGYHLGEKAFDWHMETMYQKANLVKNEKTDSFAVMEYEFKSVKDDSLLSTVRYTVLENKDIQVDIKYHGSAGRQMLPMFGWEIKLDDVFDNVEYFGKGPNENYCDRNNGSYTSVFTTTVGENLTPYLIPQECGNRTVVRYAKVTDKDGHGFLFAAKEGTFDFNFQPYSALEMENATHMDELPKRNYSWIRIMAAMMGVGGDDSWGAEVHEEFRLDSSKDYELSFVIRLI